MFKYLTVEEVSKLSDTEREKYATDKRNHEAAETRKAIDEAVKDFAKTGDIEASIKTAIDGLKATLQSDADILKELREAVNAMKDNSSNGGQPVNHLAKELKGSMTAIKTMARGARDGEEVAVKALVLRSAIGDNAQAYEVPGIGQLAHRKLTLYDLFPKVQLGTNNNGTVRYYDWDAATTVRAAASVAEGAAFPESTAKWQKYTLELKKIGDSLPVTEEFFEDEDMFAAELGMFLQTNVAIVVDTQLATGDGTSNTLTGLTNSATAYIAVAAGIQAPSIYDLIVKMSEGITKLYGSKYMPNFAVMNITDINRMALSKDHNDNYIIPPFVSRDGTNVKGITVIECNAITANTLVVGDNRYARIYEKVGATLQKGFVNNQFIEDEMTIKVRQRLLFLIRTVDKTGFLYCSDIDAALTTLAS